MKSNEQTTMLARQRICATWTQDYKGALRLKKHAQKFTF